MRRFSLLSGLFLLWALNAHTIPAAAADFETATEAVKHMGLGWNLGNTLDANSQTVTDVSNPAYWGQQGLTSENCWGQYTTKPELLNMLKRAGFGAIRVPVTWYNHLDAEGNVNPEWMARVHEVVDYVVNQGLYCIVNVHHDTGADGNNFTSWIKADEASYTQNRARYEKLWQQIAEEFRDYGQQLLFEGYNEMLDTYNSWCFASFNAPNRYNEAVATSAYNAINSYAQSFVKTVRATGGNNTQRNLIVSTYCAACGVGNWSNHLADPLKELRKPEGETSHVAFEIHTYPSIANSNNTDRPIADIKQEVDDMISLVKTHLVSKGAPVIFGEWGTSNVDAAEPDYVKRPALMKQFCQYFVQQCKAAGMATFYWMGLTDGPSRLFPAFSQPDLAEWLLQAYYGADYHPTLPVRSDYGTSCISATVDFSQQWSEFNLATGSFTSNDYAQILVELEEKPANGVLQVKIYGKSESYIPITAATSAVAFTASMGTITRITLQCTQQTATTRVKNIWLIRKNGEKVSSDPSVFWGCAMRDISINYPTAVRSERVSTSVPDRLFDLSGRPVQNRPRKGIYVRQGRKVVK